MDIKLVRWGMAGLVTSVALACSGTGSQVRGDGVSAEQHRETAARKTRAAEAERSASAAPPNLAVTPSGNPENYYLTGAGTSPEAHQARAELLRKHAQEHLALAAALDSFEENECRTVPHERRAACPLLAPVVKIDDVVGGVRVRFTDSTDMEQVVARMRCHLAFARARGFEAVASCPLYVKGVEIQPSVPQTVEIVSSDAKVAARIRVTSREEAIVVSGAGE